MYVFAYGTLMFPEIWQAVTGCQNSTLRGSLTGYTIYRVRGAVFPGIVAAGDSDSVAGVVYLDVDAESVARLDQFEDEFYVRQTLTVACDDGRSLAVEAYIVPPERRDLLTDEIWTAESFANRGDLARFTKQYGGFDRLSDR